MARVPRAGPHVHSTESYATPTDSTVNAAERAAADAERAAAVTSATFVVQKKNVIGI